MSTLLINADKLAAASGLSLADATAIADRATAAFTESFPQLEGIQRLRGCLATELAKSLGLSATSALSVAWEALEPCKPGTLRWIMPLNQALHTDGWPTVAGLEATREVAA